MSKVRTFTLFSFGCKVNQYEAQFVREQLTAAGLREETLNPDLFIVNSCAVTAAAERKCRAYIRSLIKKKPQSRIVLTGCYARIFAGRESASAGRIICIPQEKKKYLRRELCSAGLIADTGFEINGISGFSAHARAFLKVQDGCANFCAYCIVPHLRGRPQSKPLSRIKEEVRRLSENGFSEIVLTGINLGCWGQDLRQKKKISFLLKGLLRIKSLGRVRLSSLEPEFVDEELIELMNGETKICPHLHIPLQSGDDFILSRMNRRYRSADYLKIIERAKRRISGLGLSTDIIVGFPGETEKHFRNTCKLVRRAGFLRVHIFPYSRRPGTPAAELDGQVEGQAKKARKRELENIARQTGLAFRKQFLGKELTVIFEEKRDGFWQGYAANYIPVQAKSRKNLTGKLLVVRVCNVSSDRTIGKITD